MAVLLSPSARRSLKKLGADIAVARKRRRISTESMAERAQMSRMTLMKVENGDHSASMAAYMSVLMILGLEGRIADLAAPESDSMAMTLDEERLPKRIRS